MSESNEQSELEKIQFENNLLKIKQSELKQYVEELKLETNSAREILFSLIRNFYTSKNGTFNAPEITKEQWDDFVSELQNVFSDLEQIKSKF